MFCTKSFESRMKHLPPKCISQEQLMFVGNRSIRDNVLIASEIHEKWQHVKEMMRHMGFHEK